MKDTIETWSSQHVLHTHTSGAKDSERFRLLPSCDTQEEYKAVVAERNSQEQEIYIVVYTNHLVVVPKRQYRFFGFLVVFSECMPSFFIIQRHGHECSLVPSGTVIFLILIVPFGIQVTASYLGYSVVQVLMIRPSVYD